MNIEIIQSLEEIKRKNEVLWKLRHKKFLNAIKILFIVSILMLLMCLQQLIFLRNEFKNSSQFNQNSIYVSLTISIILLLYLINHFAKYKKQKRIYFENVKNLTASKIIINDESLNFKSETNEITVNWNAIKKIYVFENCLFLSQFTIKDNYEYIIDLDPIQKDEKNQLLEFAMENVRIK